MGGKTSNVSKMKYNAKAYDRLELIVRKGQKELIKEHAASQNKSVNKYINDLIDSDMKKDDA